MTSFCRGTIHRALFALGPDYLPDYLLCVNRTVEYVAHFLN